MNHAVAYASSPEEYHFQKLRKHLLSDRLEARCFLSGNPLSLSARQSVGFKVSRYNSGEMTGAMFTSGSKNKIIPPSRSGQIETSTFTLPARQKIRRSVENSALPLNYFLTLTFSPSACKDWEKDEKGNIRHDFAKFKLHRLLDNLTKNLKNNFNKQLLYVWVAELQKNGNIHFHVLLNHRFPLEYYRRRWTLGFPNVQYINDNNHAVNYMRKYMTKDDNAIIKGNRYGISQALRETMKPEEENICCCTSEDAKNGNYQHVEVMDIIKSMREEIEFGGGIVLDFGFSIPKPRRERHYIDKKTKQRRKSKGVHKKLADNVYQLITADDCPF